MVGGNPPAKGDIDGNLMANGKTLNNWCNSVVNYFNMMEQLTDAQLQGVPYNYSVQEISILRSAYRDQRTLVDVIQGLKYITNGVSPGTGVPTTGNGYDFRAFVKQTWGIGY